MNLSQYVLEPLRMDEEFVLYRAEHSSEPGLPSLLVLAPASNHPPLATLKKIEHEYSLRHELDAAWAIRPLALSEQRGQTMLALEDPGGDTLEKSLSRPIDIAQFLRFAIGLATALGGLHGRRLIHKDVKPANALIDPATGQIRLMGFGIASRLPRERQVIVCDTDEFQVDESWLSTAPARDSRVLSRTVAGHERTIIEDALRASGGRVFGPSGAAARLGVARSTIESKIRGLGIDKNRFRSRRTTP